MKFMHDGKTYLIEFRREFKERIEYDPILLTEVVVKSKFPYTIVDLMVADPNEPIAKPKVFQTATVGCWHKEKVFSLEKGRLRALRMLTKTLPEAMRPKLWEAYWSRYYQTAKPTKIETLKLQD